MSMITVQAVYTKGVLKPARKLDLPEGIQVEVQVAPLPTSTPNTNSLFGAFPELAVFDKDDMDWAARSWEYGLEKQYRILGELE